ncbi:unnamed protein product [Gordionus sp. m RMFG-2023]
MSIISENFSLESFSIPQDITNSDSSILIPAFPLCPRKDKNDLSPDKFIGSGAFGTVWSVTDPRNSQKIALKKLSNVFQNYISALRTFREIKMLNTLKHENILSAQEFLLPSRLEYFQEIYILMELMQTDLHKIMSSSQILTINHIKLFLYQILRGLKYLHSVKIMHRDIKPGNLLVNSNCLLKICDFGLARSLPDQDETSKRNLYMTTEVVTQYYRAPELLMGATYYNWGVDIWSVGCIMAEMFTRKILFESGSPIEQLELITDLLGTPPPSATRYACPAARAHILHPSSLLKLPCLDPLLSLHHTTCSDSNNSSPNAFKQIHSYSTNGCSQTFSKNHDTHCKDAKADPRRVPLTPEALHLLLRTLSFDPDHRISADRALTHGFLKEGRRRFEGLKVGGKDAMSCNKWSGYYDPGCESRLGSTQRIKAALHAYLMDIYEWKNPPLLINQFSPLYPKFKK